MDAFKPLSISCFPHTPSEGLQIFLEVLQISVGSAHCALALAVEVRQCPCQNRMPDRMSEYMPDRMSSYMPESKSKQMSDRMPERMSESMLERMSDRMSEYVFNIYFQMVCQKLCQGENHSKTFFLFLSFSLSLSLCLSLRYIYIYLFPYIYTYIYILFICTYGINFPHIFVIIYTQSVDILGTV